MAKEISIKELVNIRNMVGKNKFLAFQEYNEESVVKEDERTESGRDDK